MTPSRPLILCQCGHDAWAPLWFSGGLNRRHPDERDLERARHISAGIAHSFRHAQDIAPCAV